MRTEELRVNVGLRQGSALSPLLFIAVVEERGQGNGREIRAEDTRGRYQRWKKENSIVASLTPDLRDIEENNKNSIVVQRCMLNSFGTSAISIEVLSVI